MGVIAVDMFFDLLKREERRICHDATRDKMSFTNALVAGYLSKTHKDGLCVRRSA